MSAKNTSGKYLAPAHAMEFVRSLEANAAARARLAAAITRTTTAVVKLQRTLAEIDRAQMPSFADPGARWRV